MFYKLSGIRWYKDRKKRFRRCNDSDAISDAKYFFSDLLQF